MLRAGVLDTYNIIPRFAQSTSKQNRQALLWLKLQAQTQIMAQAMQMRQTSLKTDVDLDHYIKMITGAKRDDQLQEPKGPSEAQLKDAYSNALLNAGFSPQRVAQIKDKLNGRVNT